MSQNRKSKDTKPTNAVLNKLAAKVSSERQAVTLSLDKNAYQRLAELADKRRLKVSHIIDELVLNFLSDVEHDENNVSANRSA